MTAVRTLALALVLLAATPAAQDELRLEFEPKVGVAGARVLVKSPLPEGAQVRFGDKMVTAYRETTGFSFVVPAAAPTSFIVLVKGGKVVGKSAVPFIVTGGSLVGQPKLIGLREAIDVFGYSDPRPEGGGKPETPVHPVLKLGDEDILTIGEPSAMPQVGPAVELGDAASAATRGMGPAGFLITARPPRRKLTLPTPTPTPLP